MHLPPLVNVMFLEDLRLDSLIHENIFYRSFLFETDFSRHFCLLSELNDGQLPEFCRQTSDGKSDFHHH